MIYLCEKVYNSINHLYFIVLLTDSCILNSFVNQYIADYPVFLFYPDRYCNSD